MPFSVDLSLDEFWDRTRSAPQEYRMITSSSIQGESMPSTITRAQQPYEVVSENPLNTLLRDGCFLVFTSGVINSKGQLVVSSKIAAAVARLNSSIWCNAGARAKTYRHTNSKIFGVLTIELDWDRYLCVCQYKAHWIDRIDTQMLHQGLSNLLSNHYLAGDIGILLPEDSTEHAQILDEVGVCVGVYNRRDSLRHRNVYVYGGFSD